MVLTDIELECAAACGQDVRRDQPRRRHRQNTNRTQQLIRAVAAHPTRILGAAAGVEEGGVHQEEVPRRHGEHGGGEAERVEGAEVFRRRALPCGPALGY